MKKENKGPEFIKWFGPLLEALRELGGSAKPKTVTDLIAKKHKITSEILEQTTKSGVPRFHNQVAWARQYLVSSGYLDSSTRGIWALTEKGRDANLTTEDTQKIFAQVQGGFINPLSAPLLECLQQLGGSGKPREISELIAKNLNLPPDMLDATLKDGSLRFYNQVVLAHDHLVRLGYLDSAGRGTWVLTEKGREAKFFAKNAREAIIEEFKKYEKRENEVTEINWPEIKENNIDGALEVSEQTEQFSLLQILRSLSPKGFEEVCGLLLRESGFENVIVSGRSRDGGFDGSGRLSINPFVSLTITFQCKRYIGSVSRAEVGDFRNSMLGRAEKGIFLTTGTFSGEARKEAERVDPKIELVDGEKLVEMFQQSGLGVKPRQVYDVDTQFFEPFLK
jgi:restriction system protein